MDSPKRSFLEMEAERIDKNAIPASQSFAALIGKLIGIVVGSGFSVLFFLCFILPLTAYNLLSHGYVGMKLWQWFVIPTFHAGPITVLQAGGIMLLLRLFTYENTATKDLDGKNLKDTVGYFIGVLLIPWYSLLVGWIAHFLM